MPFFHCTGLYTDGGWWTSGSDAGTEGYFTWEATGDPILTRAQGMGWGRWSITLTLRLKGIKQRAIGMVYVKLYMYATLNENYFLITTDRP